MTQHMHGVLLSMLCMSVSLLFSFLIQPIAYILQQIYSLQLSRSRTYSHTYVLESLSSSLPRRHHVFFDYNLAPLRLGEAHCRQLRLVEASCVRLDASDKAVVNRQLSGPYS